VGFLLVYFIIKEELKDLLPVPTIPLYTHSEEQWKQPVLATVNMIKPVLTEFSSLEDD
jgi:hypothetical protein